MCCTTVKIYEKNGNLNYINYQCMNAAITTFSTGIWISGNYYEYECQKGKWGSGALNKIALSIGTLLVGAVANYI
jgi:hypothetical protein